jgi:eukaryotic-like serine/threonine-protein kinase
MKITEELKLAADVLIMTANELDLETRLRCACGVDEYVVSRPRSRSLSRVVSRDVAILLELFREPSTIVSAVIKVSADSDVQPESLLSDAFDALVPFVQARWLMAADSTDSEAIEPSFLPGALVNDFRVVDCRHFVEDTEVYQVKDAGGMAATIKIARSGARSEVAKQFAIEAEVLQHLEGYPAPQLLQIGNVADRPYIAMTWCAGVQAGRAALEIRQLRGPAADQALFELCVNILRAYCRLHEMGVIHGDVHPRNILADSKNQISLVDYGLARLVRDTEYKIKRKGMSEFYEPEFATAIALGQPLPAPTPSGEQYAIAAMIFQLLSGENYLKLSAVPAEMLRQIAEDAPRSFTEVGRVAWPALEAVLHVALSKNPTARFASLAAFLKAFSSAGLKNSMATPQALKRQVPSAVSELVRELDVHDVGSFVLSPRLPKASVTHGSAGIAIGLHQIATQQDDARVLSIADAWACRAASESERPESFFSAELGLDKIRIGESSVYYGQPGIYVAQALIARAMGDDASFASAATAFAKTCGEVNGDDLTMGRAGVVAASALLLDGLVSAHDGDDSVEKLLCLGRLNTQKVTQVINAEIEEGDYLGIAHGRAGMIYSSLLWSDVTGEPVPSGIKEALNVLESLGNARGRGLSWSSRFENHSPQKFMESWCHGSPGYVHLWTIASRVLRDPHYLNIAEQATWTAWEDDNQGGTLCCGLAGRAYALLNFFRHSGNREWLDRASRLIDRAVEACAIHSDHRYSLFQGSLGALVLASALNDLERATFPLFERTVKS